MNLNKKRSADENIGKLILFSITIIVALWLAWLVTFFYQNAKEKEIYSSVLLDVRSTHQDVNLLDWFEWCTYGISYNAITWIYNITWCTSFKPDVKWITYTSDSVVWDLKYKQTTQ